MLVLLGTIYQWWAIESDCVNTATSTTHNQSKVGKSEPEMKKIELNTNELPLKRFDSSPSQPNNDVNNTIDQSDSRSEAGSDAAESSASGSSQSDVSNASLIFTNFLV